MSLLAPRSPDRVRQRILTAATQAVLVRGYSALTMSELASELGMSKKTLYVHFPTKQALALAAIDQFAARMRSQVEAVLSDPLLSFEEKLQGMVGSIVEKLSEFRADLLRDFRRREPELYHRIESIRSQSIPYLFGRLLEEGRMAGLVREDVNLALAAEYHLHAMQGLMNPDTLARLRMSPAEAAGQALRIFFNGTLLRPTPLRHAPASP